VVPVKNKMIDAMIRGRIDLFLHHLWARFILVPPEWDLGLLMVGEAWGSVADELPLRPAGPVDFLVPWVRMVVGKIVTTHPDTRTCSHLEMLRHRTGLKP
jgi:hypothetical protein